MEGKKRRESRRRERREAKEGRSASERNGGQRENKCDAKEEEESGRVSE